MSYCRYTTHGNYICDNIENMNSVNKELPMQQIRGTFTNFNKCKKR